MPHLFRIRTFLFAAGASVIFGCFGDADNIFDPDTCVPDRIVDARIAYDDSTGDACLTWTAPDYCRKRDTVERYEIRYAYDGPFEWEAASSAIDPPAALAPGERQQYRFRYPDRGRPLFMAVASVGASGRPSRPSNTAFLDIPGFAFSGACLNAFTGAALPGIDVVVREGGGAHTLTTDASGGFALADLAPQVIEIQIESAANTYFPLAQQVVLADDIARTFPLIPHEMSEIVPSVSLLKLFKTVATCSFSDGRQELIKWALAPVKTCIPDYSNSEGIDYGAAARSAVRRWMDRTGFELFQFVDSPPDTGIVFRFLTRSEMGSLNGITRYTYGSDGLPLTNEVQIADDLADSTFVYRILLHETGHTLQFKHLSNQQFIMYYSHPLPGDISNDEVWLVRLLQSLPVRTDISIFQDVGP